MRHARKPRAVPSTPWALTPCGLPPSRAFSLCSRSGPEVGSREPSLPWGAQLRQFLNAPCCGPREVPSGLLVPGDAGPFCSQPVPLSSSHPPPQPVVSEGAEGRHGEAVPYKARTVPAGGGKLRSGLEAPGGHRVEPGSCGSGWDSEVPEACRGRTAMGVCRPGDREAEAVDSTPKEGDSVIW